ncbi:MAG TPA: preprotein translocase subunit SecE [Planctomycetota bacterium]|nr:preprotein translocase subunit SecE [Planctomycetota bacterium]
MQIYKKGQGNTARAVTALAVVAIAIFGIVESWTLWMASVPFYIAVVVMLGLAVAGVYFSLVYVRTSEFLIETQAELKKVAWPPKAEVKGSTLVVVFTVIVFGVFLFVVDWLLALLTNVIKVYPKV